MADSLVRLLLVVLAAYGAAGIVFAITFQASGAMGRLDPAARDGSRAFHAMMIPGLAALWPLMACMWISGRGRW